MSTRYYLTQGGRHAYTAKTYHGEVTLYYDADKKPTPEQLTADIQKAGAALEQKKKQGKRK